MKTREKRARRPDWDEYFMNIARAVGSRANCLRRHVAAVIVKDRQVICTGYNGTPRGIRNCDEGGCPRCSGDTPSGASLGDCICSHAEENAIAHAAYHGIAVHGATLYCTVNPCLLCAKLIINSGIACVVYAEEYHFTTQVRRLLTQAGVKFKRLDTGKRSK